MDDNFDKSLSAHSHFHFSQMEDFNRFVSRVNADETLKKQIPETNSYKRFLNKLILVTIEKVRRFCMKN